MENNNQRRAARLRAIEMLADQLVVEVMNMDVDAVDALYEQIRRVTSPVARVHDLARSAARHYADEGGVVPKHVLAALALKSLERENTLQSPQSEDTPQSLKPDHSKPRATSGMSCRDTIHLICWYLEGRLTPVVEATIKNHLDSCSDCQMVLEAAESTLDRYFTDRTKRDISQKIRKTA